MFFLRFVLFEDVIEFLFIFTCNILTWGSDGRPSISADGSALYFASNCPGGHGDHDLWQVSITPMPGDFRDDRDSDSAPESVKSNGGKEG